MKKNSKFVPFIIYTVSAAMQTIKTFSCKCLLIKTDDTITPIVLAFDECFSKKSANNYQMARDNIHYKYKYYHYSMNFLHAPFPDHSYYSLFYQSALGEDENKLNRIASQIIRRNCYGECIIVHLDSFNEFCDIDCDTFIKTYNAKNTTKKIIHRQNIKFEANKIDYRENFIDLLL